MYVFIRLSPGHHLNLSLLTMLTGRHGRENKGIDRWWFFSLASCRVVECLFADSDFDQAWITTHSQGQGTRAGTDVPSPERVTQGCHRSAARRFAFAAVVHVRALPSRCARNALQIFCFFKYKPAAVFEFESSRDHHLTQHECFENRK